MRKFLISALIGATVLPATAASAQTQELRRDRQDIREERRELRDARRYGDREDIREQREDVRDARREYREDWREYRQRNRAVYNLPRYYAPRGYVYRPVRNGVVLRPAWYGQRYWISDPYRYRLPRAYGAQRWVRYGDDVLLVNVRNGRVQQVIPDFFW